jgi:hypothetical protein
VAGGTGLGENDENPHYSPWQGAHSALFLPTFAQQPVDQQPLKPKTLTGEKIWEFGK